MAPPNLAVQHRLTLHEIFQLDGTLPAPVQQIAHVHYQASKLVLGGDSNVGKTWAETSASLAVASGTRVWDRFSTQQGPTIFFACEGMYRLTIDAIAKVARGLGIEKPDEVPFELRFRERIRLRDKTWRQTLISEIKAMEAVRVTFDPIAMAATFNELSPESWKQHIFDPIDDIIDATDAAVVLSHHANKMSQLEHVPAKAAIRGSTSLPAWADSILFMRETTNGLIIEHAKMRGGPKLGSFDMTINYGDDFVRVLCEDSDSPVERYQRIDDAIRQSLADGEPLTEGQLEVRVRLRVGGAASETIRSRSRQLVEDEVIEDVGGGGRGKPHRYRLKEVTNA